MSFLQKKGADYKNNLKGFLFCFLQWNIAVENAVMGRLEKYFEDPDKFEPERWLKASGKFPFYAFLGGTSKIVALRFALNLIAQYPLVDMGDVRDAPSQDVFFFGKKSG